MRIQSTYRDAAARDASPEPPTRSVERAETMSAAEAARYLEMSGGWLKESRTLRCMGTTGAPPYVRAGARRILYRRCDLDTWLALHVEHVGAVREASADRRSIGSSARRLCDQGVSQPGERR